MRLQRCRMHASLSLSLNITVLAFRSRQLKNLHLRGILTVVSRTALPERRSNPPGANLFALPRGKCEWLYSVFLFCPPRFVGASPNPRGLVRPMVDLPGMENRQEAYGDRTPLFLKHPILSNMRGAFVVRLGPGTEPARGRFEGSAEEVDTGKRLNFRSSEELLRFLEQTFEGTLRRERELNQHKSNKAKGETWFWTCIHSSGTAGSLRRASYNRAALQAATHLVPEGATLEIIELDGIPPFNQDE